MYLIYEQQNYLILKRDEMKHIRMIQEQGVVNKAMRLLFDRGMNYEVFVVFICPTHPISISCFKFLCVYCSFSYILSHCSVCK